MFVHAAQEHETVVIKRTDTDVAVIDVSLQKALPIRMNFVTGVNKITQIIDMDKVSSALGTSVCSALIGIHTFSGCDSISAFQGTKKTFTVASEKEEYQTAFTNLGSSFNLDQTAFKLLCKYVCHLYGRTSAKNVNDGRHKAYCIFAGAIHATDK